jgi:hypothetical protein
MAAVMKNMISMHSMSVESKTQKILDLLATSNNTEEIHLALKDIHQQEVLD